MKSSCGCPKSPKGGGLSLWGTKIVSLSVLRWTKKCKNQKGSLPGSREELSGHLVVHSPNYSLIYNHYQPILLGAGCYATIRMPKSGNEGYFIEADWTSPMRAITFRLFLPPLHENQVGHFPDTQVQFFRVSLNFNDCCFRR